ncbi:BZIP domain-containing protein [Plasmodiophora brassicae]
MTHPDDPAVDWGSDGTASSMSMLSRRERNRRSSVLARKRAKVDRHRMELKISRLRLENRLLRAMSWPNNGRESPSLDKLVVDELTEALQERPSKSKTSSIRKLIVQLLTGSSVVGHGVQNAVDHHIGCLLATLQLNGTVLDNAECLEEIRSARQALLEAKDLFHLHGERMRSSIEDVRQLVKAEQQARFMLWAYDNSAIISQRLAHSTSGLLYCQPHPQQTEPAP